MKRRRGFCPQFSTPSRGEAPRERVNLLPPKRNISTNVGLTFFGRVFPVPGLLLLVLIRCTREREARERC